MKTQFTESKNGKIRVTVRATDKEFPSWNSRPFYVDKYEVDEYVDRFVIGETTCFYTCCDVSPNAIRNNDDEEIVYPSYEYDNNGNQTPNIEGIRGNSNREIRRYHGWRGTTSDNYVTAIGMRTVLSKTKFKRGYGYSIVLSADLKKDEE